MHGVEAVMINGSARDFTDTNLGPDYLQLFNFLYLNGRVPDFRLGLPLTWLVVTMPQKLQCCSAKEQLKSLKRKNDQYASLCSCLV